MTKVQQELVIVNDISVEGYGNLVYTLQATLPSTLLMACTSVLPRPSWEHPLYYIVLVMLLFMFVVTLVVAAMDAEILIKDSLAAQQAASQQLDKDKVFDLKAIGLKENKRLFSVNTNCHTDYNPQSKTSGSCSKTNSNNSNNNNNSVTLRRNASASTITAATNGKLKTIKWSDSRSEVPSNEPSVGAGRSRGAVVAGMVSSIGRYCNALWRYFIGTNSTTRDNSKKKKQNNNSAKHKENKNAEPATYPVSESKGSRGSDKNNKYAKHGKK